MSTKTRYYSATCRGENGSIWMLHFAAPDIASAKRIAANKVKAQGLEIVRVTGRGAAPRILDRLVDRAGQALSEPPTRSRHSEGLSSSQRRSDVVAPRDRRRRQY
jgi:hypothetical protein